MRCAVPANLPYPSHSKDEAAKMLQASCHRDLVLTSSDNDLVLIADPRCGGMALKCHADTQHERSNVSFLTQCCFQMFRAVASLDVTIPGGSSQGSNSMRRLSLHLSREQSRRWIVVCHCHCPCPFRIVEMGDESCCVHIHAISAFVTENVSDPSQPYHLHLRNSRLE